MVEVETAPAIKPSYDLSIPKIKLIKNTKGYNWEISLPQDEEISVTQWLEQLKTINDELVKQYGIS